MWGKTRRGVNGERAVSVGRQRAAISLAGKDGCNVISKTATPELDLRRPRPFSHRSGCVGCVD